ncbi:MAG: hypothetical protein L0H26_06595, partial [Microlunatus sp.]|nr:hypothetical protein [Microlunatus sp.]
MTTDAPVDQPFTGQTRELNRLVRVQPGTVLVVFPPGERPRVRHPGETVLPTWNPFQYAALALPVSTGVVPLTMTISDLTTLDNQLIEQTTLKILVQLSDTEGFAAVAELAAEFGDTFGAYLMQQLQSKIESGVRGAFRMNRMSDLRRQTLASVLEDRWLPLSFANGTLLRRGLTVLDVAWPQPRSSGETSGSTVAGASPGPLIDNRPEAGPARTGTASLRGQLELSIDARLRRVWWSGSITPLIGVAGAVVGSEATVVVVCAQPPAAYDTSRLEESFARLYGERTICLVVSDATDYPALVRSWLDQVDNGHVSLRQVDSLRDGDLLRITLDRPLASPEEAHRRRP